MVTTNRKYENSLQQLGPNYFALFGLSDREGEDASDEDIGCPKAHSSGRSSLGDKPKYGVADAQSSGTVQKITLAPIQLLPVELRLGILTHLDSVIDKHCLRITCHAFFNIMVRWAKRKRWSKRGCRDFTDRLFRPGNLYASNFDTCDICNYVEPQRNFPFKFFPNRGHFEIKKCIRCVKALDDTELNIDLEKVLKKGNKGKKHIFYPCYFCERYHRKGFICKQCSDLRQSDFIFMRDVLGVIPPNQQYVTWRD